MKFFNYVLLGLAGISLLGCNQGNSGGVTIGIIEPLEHTAMNEIVAGFTDTLTKLYQKPVNIKVENAQNDANLQRAIIQKMQNAHYDFILPIGVGTTEMTLANVHQQNVVSLASDLSEEARQKLSSCNVVAVHDEISSKQLLAFIHKTYPNITHLTLVHSAADKVFPEVDATIAAGKEFGITIDHIMVSSLPDLTMQVSSIPNNTQGIFVLKDSLIVSGIGTLAKVAAARHIPLITSDEGSVENGAALALGVHERQIGIEGAKLVAEILNGKKICSLPNVDMNSLTVFVNPNALKQENQNLQAIQTAANSMQYKIEIKDHE